MSKITYADKEYIYENAEIPEINKITDGNMNEIKSVVNENDTRLTTAEGEIDTAQSDINNAEAVIGNETDTYSASSTYALGDLVIYNSLLYKCTTAITVAEAWNSAKWTQIDLLNVFSGLKGKILWTNPSPSSNFPGQTITLNDDIENYDFYEVVMAEGNVFKCKAPMKFNPAYITGVNSRYREITALSGKTMTFGNAVYCNVNTGVYNYNTPEYVKPLYIIGYKTGLFN